MKTEAVRANSPVTAIRPLDFAALLERFNGKDRQSFERQVQVYETKAGPRAAERWRRLACVMAALAPTPGKHPSKFNSSHGMQFFIPDGKYRMQVFALHGLADGSILIYLPDVLAEAPRAGLLAKPRRTDKPDTYVLAQGDETLTIETLDGKTPNPDPIFKDMTGWNRKAIRITLPPAATPAQLKAVEGLCAVAARAWPAVQEQA